ncbi:Disease resistance protein RPM1 [Triticum urartu]|uniref:Disease resistance protein RPM1 n=1 Tax=Triticum urartu TaxID=4572 RepID=M7Z555_TRIUA|nr:Disease resistance protein RPM1 [Triticum urartu]
MTTYLRDLAQSLGSCNKKVKKAKTQRGGNAAVDPRALAIFEHASKLVGIDEPKAELIKLLTKEDVRASEQQQQQLKIVSIVGSGGMGKTTLANQVYKELKGQYECWAFVSVSRNPDMANILRTILSEVAKKDYATTEAGNIQQLISEIIDFLADKRSLDLWVHTQILCFVPHDHLIDANHTLLWSYANLSMYRYFVVVDDIWDVDTWDIIKRAFPATSSTIRIITTTRMNSVTHLCCSSFSGHIYNIRALDMVHSRQLFHTRLFKSDEDCPSYLQEISKQILKKCDGLPLAIIAISGLLANTEKTKVLWNQVKDSIGHALERNPSVEGMMKILSLSYFDLPPYLKICLLYLSMYLEDSTIEKEDLIRRWIAEGFIHREGRYTAYELGERNQSKVVRRLCLKDVEEANSAVLVADLVFSHVRSLTMVRGLLEIPSLEEFRHLRVLDLMDCFGLHNHHLVNIMRLFQLRYLNIQSQRISKLPEQIGRLGCLEILNLRHTHVRELPASVVNLRKLMHLLVHDDVEFPDGIAKMQALETLEDVRVSIQPLDFLCGLGQLMNLRNLRLNLRLLSDKEGTDVFGESESAAIVSSLCKIGTQNLRSLTIFYEESILLHEESLCLPTLEDLSIWFSAFPHVPTWVGSLRNLQRLHLVFWAFKLDDLCILGALPSLLILDLVEQTESNEKLIISGEVGFRFLKIFIYDACFRPVDLMFWDRVHAKARKTRA